MIADSGLFVRISDLPPVLRLVARVLPLTYAVRLLRRHMERRRMVAPPGGRRSFDGVVCPSYVDISTSISLGVGRLRIIRTQMALSGRPKLQVDSRARNARRGQRGGRRLGYFD